ncbi:MAG: DUF2087 domain-containing protein [Bacillota bacterium]
MDINMLFWNASVEELKEGYIFDKESDRYICLICGETLEEGVVYPYKDKYVTAEKSMRLHIQDIHQGMFQHLINLNKKYTSLTDNQKEVMECFYQNMTDKETASKLNLTDSTIRNYRFKFRERENQAKIFTAIMELLHTKTPKTEKEFVEVHKSATMVDERYDITQEERKQTLSRHFDENGRLINYPSKEKRKIIVLTEIVKNFKGGVEYSEKEINRILERIYDDYALIRRYLIEYGFLDRNTDGSKYWVK